MEEKIIQIIARVLDVGFDDIELDTTIGDLPEWDSIHHLLLIKTLEEEFEFRFDPKELLELEDVSDLISLIEEKM